MEALESSGRCAELAEPGFVNLAVSIILVVGIMVSYLPQHVRIISRRTSEGISPYFVLLGTTSATSGFANILLLPQSREDVACCHELETFHCVAGLLGIAQLGIQWICFAFIFVLFLVFFRYDSSVVPEEELENDPPPSWQSALMVACLTLLHGLAVIVVTAVIGTVAYEHLGTWANVLGLMGAILAAIQYLPQIWMTYQIKHIGSLSIPMMCIQTPGGLLFAGSLFARLGPAGWSSWGIFLLTAVMQGVLLYLAIYYELQRRRAARPPTPKPTSPTPNFPSYNALDDDRPGRFSNHPQVYADDPEQYARIIDRQAAEAAAETTPLLRPGGIGDPHRNSDTNRG